MANFKETEMNDLLTEAKDMELGDESGASIGTAIAISVAVTVGTSVAMSQSYKCGVAWSVSAECSGSHRRCR